MKGQGTHLRAREIHSPYVRAMRPSLCTWLTWCLPQRTIAWQVLSAAHFSVRSIFLATRENVAIRETLNTDIGF